MRGMKMKNKEENTVHAIKERKPIITNFIDYYYEHTPFRKSKYVIMLSHKAYTKSLIYYGVAQYRTDKEVMGWLVGTRNGTQINVVDAYIGECYSESAYTEIDPTTTIKVKKQAKKEGLEIVGQWHCHPRMATFPSPTDIDSMITLDRFGIHNPVTMIVNDNEFYIGVLEGTHLYDAPFYIPAKTDKRTGLDLQPFINHDLDRNVWDTPAPTWGWDPVTGRPIIVGAESPYIGEYDDYWGFKGLKKDVIAGWNAFKEDITHMIKDLKGLINKTVGGTNGERDAKVQQTDEDKMVQPTQNKKH